MNKLLESLILDCSKINRSKVKYFFLFCFLLSIVFRSLALSTGESIYGQIHPLFLVIGGWGGLIYLGIYVWCNQRNKKSKSDNEQGIAGLLIVLGSISIIIWIIGWIIRFLGIFN